MSTPHTLFSLSRRVTLLMLGAGLFGACGSGGGGPSSANHNSSGGAHSGGAHSGGTHSGGTHSGGAGSGGDLGDAGSGGDAPGGAESGGAGADEGTGGTDPDLCGVEPCPASIVSEFESADYAGLRAQVRFLTSVGTYDRTSDLLTTPYDEWSEDTAQIPNKPDFRAALNEAWDWLRDPRRFDDLQGQPTTTMTESGGIEDNIAQPTDTPRYAVSLSDGWAIYVQWVAHSIAVDRSGDLPWSLRDLLAKDESLVRTLLNAAEMMMRRDYAGLEIRFQTDYHNNFLGLPSTEYLGMTIPGMPRYTFRFLAQNELIYDDQLQSIEALMDWSRRLVHFYGASTREVAVEHWGDPYPPTVQQIIEGTIRAGETEVQHWTMGCHGTVGFWKAVLRAINIPVRIPLMCQHALASFPGEGLFVDHGDDVYNLTFAASGCESSQLLISETTYLGRFGSELNHDDAALCDADPGPIGRQATELELAVCQ